MPLDQRDPWVQEIRSDLEHSLGSSPGWQGIEQEIGMIAGSRGNVLISGGDTQARAMLARLLHQESPQHDAPFVVADLRDRTNWRLESPPLGSLFIEDANDLTWRMQVCMLSFLEQTLSAPGAVRVIAGASPGLFSRVCARNFSADLFYRLNTIHLVI